VKAPVPVGLVPSGAERSTRGEIGAALTIPAPASSDKRAIYRQAVSVVTGGAPPQGTVIRKEWVAPFHLAGDVRAALKGARNNAYVGPFARSGSYLLVQLLASGVHHYGRPARRPIEATLFRKWLRSAARRAPLHCLDTRGQLGLCPVQIMKKV